MRIFLAGATGVIGVRLTPLLVGEGHTVAGMTRSECKLASLSELGAEPVLCDVFERIRCRSCLATDPASRCLGRARRGAQSGGLFSLELACRARELAVNGRLLSQLRRTCTLVSLVRRRKRRLVLGPVPWVLGDKPVVRIDVRLAIVGPRLSEVRQRFPLIRDAVPPVGDPLSAIRLRSAFVEPLDALLALSDVVLAPRDQSVALLDAALALVDGALAVLSDPLTILRYELTLGCELLALLRAAGRPALSAAPPL